MADESHAPTHHRVTVLGRPVEYTVGGHGEPVLFLHARTADLTAELEELKRRRLPVVVLWGRDDRIVTEASTDALCEAVEPADRITVPGGHAWMLADPEGFGEVMTNILPIAARNRTARPASA